MAPMEDASRRSHHYETCDVQRFWFRQRKQKGGTCLRIPNAPVSHHELPLWHCSHLQPPQSPHRTGATAGIRRLSSDRRLAASLWIWRGGPGGPGGADPYRRHPPGSPDVELDGRRTHRRNRGPQRRSDLDSGRQYVVHHDGWRHDGGDERVRRTAGIAHRRDDERVRRDHDDHHPGREREDRGQQCQERCTRRPGSRLRG